MTLQLGIIQNKIVEVNTTDHSEVADLSNSKITQSELRNILNVYNFGKQLLSEYECHRDNLHISNVLVFFENAEKIFNDFSQKRYEIKRNTINKNRLTILNEE